MKIRCDWAENENLRKYHDLEWGVPIFDDKKLFEFLILEGAQAGLSWTTILKKREGYKKAFTNSNPSKVAKFSNADVKKLMEDKGIIRNKLKINASVNNAKQFLEIQKEFRSFSKYIWGFINFKPIKNKFRNMSDIPVLTPLSEKISKDMKKREFKFVGPTIIYAHMQATGMVNDHIVSCFKYNQV